MTDILTREDIEEIQKQANRFTHTISKDRLQTLCRLALKSFDQPAPPSADVVERVAHAMASWDEWPQFRKNYEGIARAAIEAMKQLESKSHTGIDVADVVGKLMARTHVVVPVEPTAEMVDAWSHGPNKKPRVQ